MADNHADVSHISQGVHAGLNHSSAQVLDMARMLAQDVASRADDADRRGRLPAEDIEALRQSGFLALSVPKEYGGYGLPLLDCIAALLELSQASSSTGIVAAMQIHVLGYAAEQRPWPEPIFERICRAAVQERALFNSVASEPQLGSPSRGALFQSRAVLTPEGWVINGHKNWSTGGKHLTYLMVKLMLGDNPGTILVPNNCAGIEWVETWKDVLSLRASDSDDVYFRDVVVPDNNVLERTSRRDDAPSAWFPMVVSAVYLGAAIAARNAVIQFALDRVPTALGKPIATLPKIQGQIGEIDLMLRSALALLFEACQAWTGRPEDRQERFTQVLAAKTLANEVAPQATALALRIAGGSSITHNLPLERYFRDSQPGFTHPPSGDLAREIIGQHAIKQWQSTQPQTGAAP